METSVKRIVTRFGKTPLLLAFISCILAFPSCTEDTKPAVPYYKDASFSPIWNPDNAELAAMHTIAPFHLINQYGEPISNSSFLGKVYLVNFFFTSCPSICPKLTNTMKLVYEQFEGNDSVQFLSHSVTPDIDTPARLYRFARQNNIRNRQWQLATGDKTAIYTLARKSYFIEEEMGLAKTSRQFLHTENFVLIDQQGHIRGLYNGTLEAEVPRIVTDINILIKR